jgi:hypothetical protein
MGVPIDGQQCEEQQAKTIRDKSEVLWRTCWGTNWEPIEN